MSRYRNFVPSPIPFFANTPVHQSSDTKGDTDLIHTAHVLKQLCQHDTITPQDITKVFDELATVAPSSVSPIADMRVAGLLSRFTAVQWTPDLILAAAHSMRQNAKKAPPMYRKFRDGVDIVGTGGDHCHTPNISTTSALVAAACGLPVAKHGGRKVSSLAGASDFLSWLGIDVTLGLKEPMATQDIPSFVFLFAPLWHPSGAIVAKARQAIAVSTVFNILGPLVNPLCPSVGIFGCADSTLLNVYAAILPDLGVKQAWVLHNSCGLDELAPCGTTEVLWIDDNTITAHSLTAQDFNLPSCEPSVLCHVDKADSFVHCRDIIHGKDLTTPLAHAVMMNAAAALLLHHNRTTTPTMTLNDLPHFTNIVRKHLTQGNGGRLLEHITTS